MAKKCSILLAATISNSELLRGQMGVELKTGKQATSHLCQESDCAWWMAGLKKCAVQSIPLIIAAAHNVSTE